MAIKTKQLKCERNTAAMNVHFMAQVRDGEEWKTQREATFEWADLPADVQAFASLYGLSKLLQDRTSDAGKMKLDTLEWMQQVYGELKVGNLFKKRVAGAGRPDLALVALVAAMKKISVTDAEAALVAAGKEAQQAIAAKYATQLAEQRKKAVGGKAVVELGDLL